MLVDGGGDGEDDGDGGDDGDGDGGNRQYIGKI